MGQDLMFLREGKMEKIKIKFLYKPGIEILDFIRVQNDLVLLTSYFSLEFYNTSQESACKFIVTQTLIRPSNCLRQ